MYILRTKFKGEIISEFLPPLKPSSRVIVLCYGMPGMPKLREVMEFLSKKNYWVFLPRYRGSWESGGEFLKNSPHEDILDVMDELPKGFIDLWSGKKYKIKSPEVYLFGSSFGGPAAILASKDSRVKKAVCSCAVIDWRDPSEEEPMDKLGPFIKDAFGMGYRFTMKNWKRLSDGKFYNPISEISKIDGSKLLLIHAKDDEVVSYKPTVKFAEMTGSKLILLNKGGHLGSKIFMNQKIWTKIKNHLKD